LKGRLFYIFIILYQVGVAQQVDWIRVTGTAPQFMEFHQNPNRIYIAGCYKYGSPLNIQNSTFFGNQTFSLSYHGSHVGIVDKNGHADTIFSAAATATAQYLRDFLRGSGNNFYIAGTASGAFDYCFSKTQSTGAADWGQCYTSQSPYNNPSTYYPHTIAESIIENTAGLFITGTYQDSMFIGNTWLYGKNALITRVDPQTGNIVWAKSIPGFHYSSPKATHLANLTRGGLLLGVNIANGGVFGTNTITIFPNYGSALAIMDTTGNFTHSFLLGEGFYIHSMTVDKLDNYYIAGAARNVCSIGSNNYTLTPHGMFVMKTDKYLNIHWLRVFDSPSANWRYGQSAFTQMHLTNNDELYISGSLHCDTLFSQSDTIFKKTITGPWGSYYRDALLMKYSASTGSLNYVIQVKDQQDAEGYDVTTDDEGAAYWSGKVSGHAMIGNDTIKGPGYFLVRFKDSPTVGITENKLFSSVKVYPNPAKSDIIIETDYKEYDVELFDIYGRKIKHFEKNSEASYIRTENLNRGVYLLSITSPNDRSVHRIILE
jgi:hypothetical protein